MDSEEMKSALKNMGVTRRKIFVSLSHEDKDIAIPLLEMMEERHLDYWCMYTPQGTERNKGGDNFKQIIPREINSCCLFLFLFSERSIKSAEVHDELYQIAQAKKSGEHVMVFPVRLDAARYDIPENIKKLNLFEEGLIFRALEDKTDSSFEHLMTEIRTQYYDMLIENINFNYTIMTESRRFNDLLCKCIGSKCYVRTVSQDIKSSDEGSGSSLLEAHILTDELRDYDFHPYSCMLISGNLLGKYDEKEKKFKPAERGVKYFYYCPEDYLAEIKAAYKNKLRSYIMRDAESRSEVVCLIRREFVERNKIKDFFELFNRLTVQDLINKYNITATADRQNFREAMESDENCEFFSYNDSEEDWLEVPDEFMSWLSGDYHRASNRHVVRDAYAFIDFLNRLVVLIGAVKTESPARDELVENLKMHCRFLNNLVTLEKWQTGKLEREIRSVEAKKLCNQLINFTVGSKTESRKLPNLSNWMRFYYDNDGKDMLIPDETIEQALDNVTFIPVKKHSKITPCYSFVLYLNRDSTSASWYSTGYEGEDSDMVISYVASPDTNEYVEYQEAFLALIENDKDIKAILREKNSRILQRGDMAV